eukprot:1666966-Alexandrium_andersonii.AAC.1
MKGQTDTHTPTACRTAVCEVKTLLKLTPCGPTWSLHGERNLTHIRVATAVCDVKTRPTLTALSPTWSLP